MTKKRLFIGLVSAAVIIFVTLFVIALEPHEDDNEVMNVDLYFFNDTYTSITAEKREIKTGNGIKPERAVLDKLFEGPSDSKLKPIFENGTVLLSMRKDHRRLTLDFSEQYIAEDNSRRFLATYAIVKSLCQLNDVEQVLVTVEGEKICDSEGNETGFLSDKDIDLVSDAITQDSKNVTLYFPDKSSDKLLSEQRKIKINDTVPLEQYVVNELIKGTQSQRARNVISSDTVLISAETTDNTCFVNFKSGFVEKNTGNPANEKLIIYSIVNSICELRNVNFVQFLIDGKKTDKFGTVDISNFFVADKKIIAG